MSVVMFFLARNVFLGGCGVQVFSPAFPSIDMMNDDNYLTSIVATTEKRDETKPNWFFEEVSFVVYSFTLQICSVRPRLFLLIVQVIVTRHHEWMNHFGAERGGILGQTPPPLEVPVLLLFTQSNMALTFKMGRVEAFGVPGGVVANPGQAMLSLRWWGSDALDPDEVLPKEEADEEKRPVKLGMVGRSLSDVAAANGCQKRWRKCEHKIENSQVQSAAT